jgi:hypothetical protein
MPILTFIIVLGAGLISTILIRLETNRGIATLGRRRGAMSLHPLLVGVFCFVSSAIGVVLSYLAFDNGFSYSAPYIASMIGVTFVINTVSYGLKTDKDKFSYGDFITFGKDGFLWMSAFPTLAIALGETNGLNPMA